MSKTDSFMPYLHSVCPVPQLLTVFSFFFLYLCRCCLTVKGLTEKFKEKDTAYSGSATFTYEAFMLTVLPFLIA